MDGSTNRGYLSDDLHAWLRSLTMRLAPRGTGRSRRPAVPARRRKPCQCDGRSRQLHRALNRLGRRRLGDPAVEFRCAPRCGVHVLAGYREIAPLDGDETAEARILYDHVMAACYYATRAVHSEAQNWGRPPAGRFVELSRSRPSSPRSGRVSVARDARSADRAALPRSLVSHPRAMIGVRLESLACMALLSSPSVVVEGRCPVLGVRQLAVQFREALAASDPGVNTR